MNERYTYGYGIGWNVENEYINSLSLILEQYNNQTKVLEDLNRSIESIEKQIEAKR